MNGLAYRILTAGFTKGATDAAIVGYVEQQGEWAANTEFAIETAAMVSMDVRVRMLERSLRVRAAALDTYERMLAGR